MAAEAAVSTAVLKLGDLLTRKVDLLRGGGVIGEVQQLKDELKGVQCFLRDASGKQADDVAIRDWIAETGEVAHDAEDAVEVFIFKVERARIVLASFASSLKHKYLLKRFSRSINSIRKRLRGIEGRRSSLGIQDLGDRPSDGLERLPKLSQWQKDKHIVGMEKDIELVLEKAILNEGDDISISGIVGEGGTGKSTLARILYNHAAVADRFERRAWAVASKERRPRDIIKELYLQVKSGETMEWEMNFLERMELLELQQELYKRLEGKRYFIVLDDMWDDAQWNDALAGGFPNEGTGSRFLITMHTPTLEDDSEFVHTMKCLDSDESWILFMNTVSDGKGVDQDLEDIGRQILNKCDGLPLAITLVGGLLMKQKRSKTEWEKVLEEMESHLNRSSNDAMQAILELSYRDLSPELKLCFLCLGFFEAGDTINARKLIDVWISEGFIPEEGGKTMEETAMAYLEELIDRNMVQMKDVSFDDRVKNCVMHDLVRDLSIRKAEEEIRFEILNEDGESSSHKPRHRVLDCRQGRFNDSIYGNKQVRSLVVRRGAQPYLFTPSFSSYWMSFMLLRVLDFEGCVSMTQLPVSIGALISLRYLCLRNTGIQQIPNWLPRLVNLEVLDMRGVTNMEMSDIFGKMLRLRCLYASSFYFTKPPEISGLKFLQTLSYVNLNYADVEKVLNVTSLSTLGINLFRISDSWLLFHLLGKMEKLVHLKLRYCKTLNLDKLGSLHRLTRLKLHGEIPVLPSAFPPNLTHLTLDSLRVREDPMPLLQNLQKLSYLKMDWAYEGAKMVISHNGFPVLKVLILHSMIALGSILVEEGAMPELRRLEIIRCSSLERLPEEMMKNLEELKVVASKKTAANLRGEDSHMISNIPYVQIIGDTGAD
ncbi:probable disease resistance protein At1g58602 isoform X2 [Salvia miltiorrhiza]|uniref:probable disease resistance protein At1g58602 isoform X2 n=1 Tax=Salvia miltiorrhiza TaxID=226208 RepID=UPI0025ACEF25|nr:probable disease resistance protein At1g58602 isoform X2 [Salvia miltiorrhiza]